ETCALPISQRQNGRERRAPRPRVRRGVRGHSGAAQPCVARLHLFSVLSAASEDPACVDPDPYMRRAPRRNDRIARLRGLPVFLSSYLVLPLAAGISILETVMLSSFISPVSAI